MRASIILSSFLVFANAADRTAYREWRHYGGGPESIRYSTLSQIDRSNVGKLETAWTFDTGDALKGSEMQCNPIIIDGVMYVTSPKTRVLALDAATGRQIWAFNPHPDLAKAGRGRNRGVAFWTSGGESRVFVSVRSYLYALDAKTGRPIPSFGDGGKVDLREGLGRDPRTLNVTSSSPGIVFEDLLVVPTLMSEDLPSAPGDIRAFDVRTGKIRWTFHTIPHPGEFGYDTWPPDAWTYAGGANNWPGMALDVKRGLLFVPTGSASADFYGANRAGANLFANTLLCLKAATGERVWHFQAVHHDLWDRDFPTPPSLITIRRNGRTIDAVAQATKSAHVFVFERETGKPLFPIEERGVPKSEIDGEWTAPTQPLPLAPPPFSRQLLTEDLLTDRTPEARRAALERFRKVRSAGQWVPPSFEGSIVFPGFDGGAEWGGQAFDPETGLYYVNANEMAWILRLVPRPVPASKMSGSALYRQHCASCHNQDRTGTPPEFPSLVNIAARLSANEIRQVTREGSGRMPSFAQQPASVLNAITGYLLTGRDETVELEVSDPAFVKYRLDGYAKFLDPDGYPAIKPPWGTLTAIDMNKGKFAWQIPLGEFPELAAKGLKNTGTENYGGPVVTAGGLVFIGATNHDRKFRAFDKRTGKLLWETRLPFSGNATPATYMVNGRQYVVIACGGGKSGAPSGGVYVAFALPR
ncbi:MAG: PQQ-binding-like beta-propeller repeat protein [Bryobacteraceae bacterium]